MRRFWLRLLWGIGLLLFILLAGVAIFGGDLGRRLIEHGASRYLADQLQIEHGLNWQLWPHPGLRIRGLHVQDASGQTKARVGSLELSLYGRKSLLQGQWALRHIELEDVELYLNPERLQAATWLRQTAGQQAKSTAPPALPAIDRLTLNGLKLHYQQAPHEHWLLTLDSAELQERALTARFGLRRQQQEQTALALTGQLDSTLLWPTATTPPAIEQLQMRLQGQLADWQLASHLALEQLSLADDAPTPPQAIVLAASLQRDQQELALAISGHGQPSRLKMVASAREHDTAQFIGRLDGTLEQLAANSAVSIERAHLLIANPAKAKQLHQLVLENSTVQLNGTDQQLQARLKGTLDREPLQARLSAQTQSAPFLQIKAQLARLDLDRYLADGAQKPPANTTPMAADFWHHLPITLDLSVKTLHFNDINSHNVRLRLYNQNQGLAISLPYKRVADIP